MKNDRVSTLAARGSYFTDIRKYLRSNSLVSLRPVEYIRLAILPS